MRPFVGKYDERGRRACLALTTVLVATMFVAPMLVSAQGRPFPTRHVRDAVFNGQALYTGRTPAAQTMRLSIVLPLRNEDELDQLIEDLYNPQSSQYHEWLSVEEFTSRFGPTQEDYDAVVNYVKSHGLAVIGTAPNRLVVDVQGPAARVERALHVNMGLYQHPTEGRTFFAPDREPSLDLKVPIWHIAGLDNYSIPRPMNLHREALAEAQAVSQATGSGPSGYFLASDFRTAYYGAGSLNGSGQAIGLLEFAGYNINDVNTYFSKFPLPTATPYSSSKIKGVSTDGSSLSCKQPQCDDGEQVLDIEVALSMAPGVSAVYVYVSTVSDVSILNRMATDNKAKSLSCSWGWSPADPLSDDPIFKQFAAQGQNMFVASGDSGAYKSNSRYVFPADDPYVTSVGGTNLTTGPGQTWVAETAWSYSGGGISPNAIPIPSYQTTTGVITTGNKGSKTRRNAPDVAAEANTDNYICYNGTCAGGWGGTSFAAPRWAGYMALMNQQAMTNLHHAVGFINPTLYKMGLSDSASKFFHDITMGNNGTYSAMKGYDLVTGWGSPNGTALITYFSTH